MMGEINKVTAKISSFIRKLFQLLEDQHNHSIIDWGHQPNQLVVHNVPQFAQTLLPKIFKHNNYSSFVRQLNMYGFMKVKSQENTYQHKFLDRDNPQLLSLIKRRNKISDLEDGRSKQRIEDQQNFEDFQEQLRALNKQFKILKKENRILKKQKEGLTKEITLLRKNFNKMICENLLEAFHETRGINERHIEFLQQILQSNNLEKWNGQVEGKEQIETLQILNFILQQKIYCPQKVKIVIEQSLEGTDIHAEQFQLRSLSSSMELFASNINEENVSEDELDKLMN